MIFQLSWILSKAMVLLIVSLCPLLKLHNNTNKRSFETWLTWPDPLPWLFAAAWALVWAITPLSQFFLLFIFTFYYSSHLWVRFFYCLFYHVRLFFTFHFIKSFLFAHMLVWAITPLNICVSTDFFSQRFWFDKFQLVVIIQYFINHIKIFDTLPLPKTQDAGRVTWHTSDWTASWSLYFLLLQIHISSFFYFTWLCV